MKRLASCPRESDVLDLVWTRQWPARADASLLEHVSTCALCSDLAVVASAMGDLGDASTTDARVPDAAAVWYRAQALARQELTRRAARPMVVAEVAAALAALGAGFAGWKLSGPYIAAWWTARPGWPLPALPAWSDVAWLGDALSAWPWMLAVGAAWALTIPAAYYVARVADRTTEP